MSPRRQTRADELMGLYFGLAMRSGLWYRAFNHNTSTGIRGEAGLEVVPVLIGRDCTLDRIATATTVVGSAGNVIRLGIWYDDGTVYPGKLLLDAGTVDGTTGPGLLSITISQPIKRGLYWVGGVNQGAAGTRATSSIFNGHQVWGMVGDQAASPAIANGHIGYSQASVTGAFGASFTATVTMAGAAMNIALRAV